MMEEPQPLAPALSSLKTAAPAPATPSKSVNFKISPVSQNRILEGRAGKAKLIGIQYNFEVHEYQISWKNFPWYHCHKSVHSYQQL